LNDIILSNNFLKRIYDMKRRLLLAISIFMAVPALQCAGPEITSQSNDLNNPQAESAIINQNQKKAAHLKKFAKGLGITALVAVAVVAGLYHRHSKQLFAQSAEKFKEQCPRCRDASPSEHTHLLCPHGDGGYCLYRELDAFALPLNEQEKLSPERRLALVISHYHKIGTCTCDYDDFSGKPHRFFRKIRVSRDPQKI
jgi:hypothetical protein